MGKKLLGEIPKHRWHSGHGDTRSLDCLVLGKGHALEDSPTHGHMCTHISYWWEGKDRCEKKLMRGTGIGAGVKLQSQ